MSNDKLQRFEDKPIRTVWDGETEERFSSVVDVVKVLIGLPDIRHVAKYWSVMKVRMKKEDSQPSTSFYHLKQKAIDGKQRLTYIATTEQATLAYHPVDSNSQSRAIQTLDDMG